ncbi:hypothetical protein A1OE_1284 [Candidatus Endolissoclinum faulkneri L2]|uniref:Uncharacterized protein n=1 Tax=Candidatus Endolissoclinum faulkneri L2 TaxID=1193729 RepID=K7YPM6_9PROT|nr:hypothetical protein A1OE_1284 [Candidatus Endolissoclinum faulkneri L2]
MSTYWCLIYFNLLYAIYYCNKCFPVIIPTADCILVKFSVHHSLPN